MDILLTTLNAKYSHSNLALRYLRAYSCRDFPSLRVQEYNINQDLQLVYGELIREKPHVLGFSCYIWNIREITALTSMVKAVLPETTIVLGGPEVSFEYEQVLVDSAADFIIAGEGEEPFHQLLQTIYEGKHADPRRQKAIPGLVYRQGEAIRSNEPQIIDLSTIPSPFDDHLDELDDRIVYVETSRGCPFNCSYCLSSRTGKLRFFPMDRCLRELTLLSQRNPEQIRFVDRTFNSDAVRAEKLVAFMATLETTTRFQLEVAADRLTDSIINALKTAPKGRFHLEVGVQSTNAATLEAVQRCTDFLSMSRVMRRLAEAPAIPCLVDLIAGLPHESMPRFLESFNYVYQLQPSKIHLGFLKLLKGSKLRAQASEFGCRFAKHAPYEVLQTDHMSPENLSELHTLEDLVERLYNSGRFQHVLAVLTQWFGNPAAFFTDAAENWQRQGWHMTAHSLFSLYDKLFVLYGAMIPGLKDVLHFDFRLNEPKRTAPAWMGEAERQRLSASLKDGTLYQRHQEFAAFSPRELRRRLWLERFDSPVYPEPTGVLQRKTDEPQFLLFFFRQLTGPAEVLPWTQDGGRVLRG